MTINLTDIKDALAIIVSVVAIVGPIVPYFMVPSRRRLRTDIEILNILQKNPGHLEDQAYIKVKEKIDKNISEIYSDSILSSLTRGLYILVGFILIGLSVYITFNLVYPKFSWWALLSIYLASVGIAYLLAGIYGRGYIFQLLKLIPKTANKENEHGQK